jgi:hypothetical protein
MNFNDVLKKIPITSQECTFLYRSIILLFELADPDDNAYNFYDNRIQNYCNNHSIIIIPHNHVSSVDLFIKKFGDISKKYPSGFVIFAHSGKNQLRKLIHHMRNACSHGGITIIKRGKREHIRFTAKNPKTGEIQLLLQMPRDEFIKFWEIILNTLKFK